jgi:hypothetical protein
MLPLDAPPPVLKNEENKRCGFFVPHLGQVTSSSLSCIVRKDSNFSPHCLHLYAYIGMSLSLAFNLTTIFYIFVCVPYVIFIARLA